MELFSKELIEFDRNTVKYMISEMQNTIDEQDKQLKEQDKQLKGLDKQLEELDKQRKQLEQENISLMTQRHARKVLYEKFEFRNIRREEADEAAEIERICFPPNEACTREMMLERVMKAPELFLVAVDRKKDRIAGFLNGLSSSEDTFRDEFFMNADMYDPDGKNIMLLGLDVLPEYRMQGLARELMNQYLKREQKKGRKLVLLTCLESKVKMYEKMGFHDNGIADSSWGGEEWHEMARRLVDMGEKE